MNRSVDRILTTHAGSLPRLGDLLALIQAKATIALNSSPNAA
jgi:hypothetical protein